MTPERKAELRELISDQTGVRMSADNLHWLLDALDALEKERDLYKENLTETLAAAVESHQRAENAEARIAKLEAALRDLLENATYAGSPARLEQERIAREALEAKP